jgi:hypothetical protein
MRDFRENAIVPTVYSIPAAHIPLSCSYRAKELSIMKSAKYSSDSPEFYSLQEAAWALGITAPEVCRLVRTSILPATWRRSRLVIRVSDVARLLPTADERRCGDE